MTLLMSPRSCRAQQLIQTAPDAPVYLTRYIRQSEWWQATEPDSVSHDRKREFTRRILGTHGMDSKLEDQA